jgi:DNA-directed RNA polymerase subunit RPC12/RpoP
MADVLKFSCSSCEKKISVRTEYAGKKVKCPGCQKPLRVPAPRPKRSSTGVPIAAGTDSGSSSAGAKSYSLADLAEMEANADAEIKELSHKAQVSSIRIPNGKDCPECGSSCKPDAVLCVSCGHSFEGGEKLKTKKSKEKVSRDKSAPKRRLWGLLPW